MGIKLTNNAFATLAAGINSSATSITVTTGQGARFPTLSAGDYFYATLVDTSNNLEIVKCTSRSTDVLTVVRAQETTTARAYSTGDRIEIRLTAATFLDAAGVVDGAVTESKIATGAVTSTKVAAGVAVANIGYTPANKAGDTFTGAVIANQFKNTFTTLLDDYRTTSPAADTIILCGTSGDRDCWIFRDPAGGAANWGIYHRQIDSAVGGVAANSIVFVGATAAAGYIGLSDKVWGIGANLVPVSSGGAPTGSIETAANVLWFPTWYSTRQRAGYDRGWDNYPAITVFNHTDQGPQGEFRIHGANGASGGDIAVSLRIDGSYLTGSDERRKTNIENIVGALDTVKQLSGKKFNIINREGNLDPVRGNKKQYGLIAQQCKDVIPDAVTFYPESDTPNENGWASAYSIDYSSLVPLLIESIKEQQQQIETLKTEVAALKAGA